MSIRKRLVVACAAVALVVASAGAGFTLLTDSASASKDGLLDDGKELLPKAGITLDQAIAAAQAAESGVVDEVDLEYWNGTLVFNVDVGDKDVKVDAATGKVLASESDD